MGLGKHRKLIAMLVCSLAVSQAGMPFVYADVEDDALMNDKEISIFLEHGGDLNELFENGLITKEQFNEFSKIDGEKSDDEELIEGSVEPDGNAEGEGSVEPDGNVEREGTGEGSVETDGNIVGEGTGEESVETDGNVEGEGTGEGSVEPDGNIVGEGTGEESVEPDGNVEGEGTGEGSAELDGNIEWDDGGDVNTSASPENNMENSLPNASEGLQEVPVLEDEAEIMFLQDLAAGGSVEVSTHAQFVKALNDSGVNEIVVTKGITLSGDADNGNDQSLMPVMFRGDLTIKGKSGANANIFFRSPIQLKGGNVTFKDIELNFISSGALGSVPHREIFLAGHSLTLDNVKCYTKGADGSLGGFGGTEEELLPTIYAGGYKGTSVAGSGASLTIKNSNDDTDIKAIYAGHDEEQYEMAPYKGDIDIEIDSRASVREGIFASKNNGNVNITIKGNQDTCRIKDFEGNDNTTVTFDNIFVNMAEVNGGNIVLSNGTVFEPVSKSTPKIGNIQVSSGTTLNLAYMLGAVIEGDFAGGGTLILDKDDTLTVNGEISGTTLFKTWSGTAATGGSLIHDRDYIVSSSKNVSGSIELDPYYGKDYALEYNDGVWTAKSNLVGSELDSFEVLSGPGYVDFDTVKKETLDKKIKPSYIFATESKDKEGNIFHTEAGLYTYVLKKEDLNTPDKQDWLIPINVEEFGTWQNTQIWEGKYFITFDESNIDAIEAGEYVVFFAADDLLAENVAGVVNNSVGRAEFTIYKNEGSASKEIKAEHAGAVPPQKYTGREVKPKVDITVDGVKLTEGKDYVLKYNNNINVTTDGAKAKINVEGIGEYSGSFALEFDIAKGEAETENAVTAEKAEYTYGDTVRLTFTAVPKKDANQPAMLAAAENKVEFYCGDKLLGMADVVNGKAVLLYDTRKQLVPVGAADITIKFGGSSQLEAAEFTAQDIFILNKKKLGLKDIASISMESFVYNGSKKDSSITDINWNDPSVSGITFEGRAELSSPNAGVYSKANIISLKATGKTNDWYDTTNFAGNFNDVTVSPEVVIRKAPSAGTVFKTLTFNAAENGASLEFDNSIVPDGYEVVNVTEGSASNYGNVVSNVAVTNDKVTFNVSGTDGRGTINAVFEFKNHENISLMIDVVKTSKTQVDAGFKINDMEYSGLPYDAWEIGAGYSKDDVTATYYDIDEQKELSTAPVNAGRYSVNLRLETADSFAEANGEFEITKKQVDLKAVDRTIKAGNNAPNLDNPQEGVDYEFTSGKPSENIGSIKMTYDQTPNTDAAGKYEILIGIPVLLNENYSVNAVSGWLTVESDAPVVEYDIKVKGGHADTVKASAGEKVTITAEEPQGKDFVRWVTTSAGVTIADPESAVTTFTMPANNVEITAEFKDEEAQRYDIKVTGGHADKLKASAGEKVTITAEEPQGKDFVRWETKSSGVMLDNPESVSASFIMPPNSIEIMAEFKDEEAGHVPVEKIEINMTDFVVRIGSKKMIKAAITPENATNKEVVWSISGDAAEIVPLDGDSSSVYIEGKSVGTVTVTATSADSGLSASSVVNIKRKSSSSDSGSSSGGGSSSSNGSDKETIVYEDGSEKTTTTEKDGTITEVTKKPDGTVTTVIKEKDGTKSTTVEYPDGGRIEETVFADGTSVSTEENTQGQRIKVTHEGDGKTYVKVWLENEGELQKVKIRGIQGGQETIPYFVKDDGTVEYIKYSYMSPDGMVVMLSSDAEFEVKDNGKTFGDVSEDDWYYDAVAFAVSHELFFGTNETEFSPEGNMTRGMAAEVLYRLAGRPQAGNNVFTDVSENGYYSDAVAWAYGKGILSGVGDGRFMPDDHVTKEQLAVILYMYGQSMGMENVFGAYSGMEGYVDVSPWAAASVDWAVKNGVMTHNVYNGQSLQVPASRADVAEMLYNYVKYVCADK